MTILVAVSWLVLFSASSFACNLCVELEKRGFSPESIGKAVSEHFGVGSRLKAIGSGKPFSADGGVLFNIAIGKNGKVYPVKETKQLRGLVFDGSINSRPAKIFLVNQLNFIGIKADGSNFRLTGINASRQTAAKNPVVLAGSSAKFKYSNETIQVPPDIEGR